jgi:hypothetical protein
MKAYEFPAKVKPDGSLELPESLSKILPTEETVRAIILVSETTDAEGDAAWSRLTAEQFLAGYSEADSIYDEI